MIIILKNKEYKMADENIVKKTCKELGITQKELAERMGVAEGTMRNWSSNNDIPEWAQKFITTIAENEKNKNAIAKFKEFIELTK